MKRFSIIAATALALFAASACQKELSLSEKNSGMKEVTLTLGFDTKTYLYKGNVVWCDNEHIQVFTDKDKAYDFSSTSKKNDPKATFTGEIPKEDKIKYILYTGKKLEVAVSASKMSIDTSGNIVGTEIYLTEKQDPSLAHTFKNNYAYAIMKDGDAALKNLFGLVKMNFPAYESGQSRIHRVVISADQFLSGRFSLDYKGIEPVMNIIDNSVAKKTITVTTRWATDKYESGEIYGLLAPGTYTGFKITVYPFKQEPTVKADTVIGTPFTIEALNSVTITRNNWIDAGTIPYEKPAAKTKCSTPKGLSASIDGVQVSLSVTKASDAENYVFQVYNAAIPDSGEPSSSNLVASDTLAPAQLPYIPEAAFTESTQYWFRVKAKASALEDSDWAKSTFTTGFAGKWPNDPSALDYGLKAAWTATIDSTTFPGYISGTTIPEGHLVVDKVTYGYRGKCYIGRYEIAGCFSWDTETYKDTAGNAVKIPKERFEMFKINKPGTLSFIPKSSNTTSIVIALIVKKNNEETASYVYERKDVVCYNKNDKESFRQNFEITEAMLDGIQQSATLYIFCNINLGFHCLPITWTPAPETKASISTSNNDFSEGWKL